MPIYEFKCNKCKKKCERFCSYENIKNQKCEVCGTLLTRLYSSLTVIGFPEGWSTYNSPNIAKPRTEQERKKYRDFMENSEPYH